MAPKSLVALKQTTACTAVRTFFFFFFFPLCDCHDQEVCDKVVLLSELKKKSYSV